MNPRERMMLMLGVVLLGGVIWKFMIYDPQSAQYTSLVAARDAAKAELIRDQQILAREAEVRQEYARLSAFVVIMEAKLPSQKELPPLLTTMEQFTRRLGIGLEAFRPSALQPVTGPGAPGGTGAAQPPPSQGGARMPTYSKMDVNLGLTGTFAQMMAYLRDLRALPRLVIVNGVTMAPEKAPRLTVSIASEIYVVTTPTPAVPRK